MDEDLKAFFRWCEEEEARTTQWLQRVTEEETDWDTLLNSDPIAGDIY